MSSLQLDDLEVAYGGVPAVRGLSLSVAPGEIVGLDRPERRREVDHAARDHGARPRAAGRDPSRRAVAPRLLTRGGRPQRDRARTRGPSALRRAHGGGEPAARARRPAARERRWRGHRRRRRALPSRRRVQEPACRRALRRTAAAAGNRPRARCAALDPPPRRASLGLAPTLVDLVFSTLQAIAERGIGVLLVEQRAQRTVALAARTHVLANGELRLTLTPDDAADTDRMVAAYLS